MSEPIHINEYEELIREVLASGGEFRLYPHGTSMLPLLRQGRDSVVLRKMERSAKKHDIIFYQRADGSYVLHRVKKASPEGLTLWGDNQHLLEKGVTEEQIIGRVTRIFRDEDEVNCQGLGYRGYVWLWQFMALRKFVLYSAYFLRKEIDSNA